MNLDSAALDQTLESLKSSGFCCLPAILDSNEVIRIIEQLELVLTAQSEGVLTSRDSAYGVRNLLQLWPEVVSLLQEPVLLSFLRSVLGPNFGLVRVLFFDKPPGRSWTLPWHRDRTIAVRSHEEVPAGFSNPTTKAGLPHLVAPEELLNQMLTLRFSLDPMTEENGPLVVIPASHQSKHSADSELAQMVDSMHTVFCEAGDVFVMRPLLAHSSLKSKPETALRRRVLHFEISGCPELPGKLQWQEYYSLG
ncbi:MAG: phytanoyl-CoA dioxygenase family protein [Planctomycetota bacterium]